MYHPFSNEPLTDTQALWPLSRTFGVERGGDWTREGSDFSPLQTAVGLSRWQRKVSGVISVFINPQENWLLPLLIEGEMTFPSVVSHQVEKRVADWSDVLLPWTILERWPLCSTSGLSCPAIYLPILKSHRAKSNQILIFQNHHWHLNYGVIIKLYIQSFRFWVL